MQECCCFVTVETPGKPVRIHLWTGSSFKNIRDAAIKKYKGSHLAFGNSFWRTL